MEKAIPDKSEHKIIFDTNFIINCVKHKVDFKAEINRLIGPRFRLYILDRSITEMDIVASREPKYKPIVKLAKSMAKAFQITTIHTHEPEMGVDALLVEKAKEGYIVGTNDKELKKAIKSHSGDLLVVRKDQFLVFSKH